MTDDRRLIKGDLPIKAIRAAASREKSVRKGHTPNRRPLVGQASPGR